MHNPEIKTEIGACIVLSNYRNIVSAIKEKGIVTEKLLPSSKEGIPISQALNEKTPSYSKIAAQLKIYLKHVSRYQKERYLPNPSPDFFELSFDAYAKKYGMPDISILLKHFVPGFGYPVAVCNIKGFKPEHHFFAEGLEYKNFKKDLGEPALITIRDGREPEPAEGRLCNSLSKFISTE